MRIFNLIFGVLFVISAILQYNDPDPFVWISIYLYGAVLCFLASVKKYYPAAYFVGILLFIIYAVFLLFTANGVLDWITIRGGENLAASMKAGKPWIENAREFFGLCILIVILLINLIYARRLKTSAHEAS